MDRTKQAIQFFVIYLVGLFCGICIMWQEQKPTPPKSSIKYVIVESDTIVKFQGELLFDGTIEYIASKKYNYVIGNNAFQILFKSKDTVYIEKNTYIESAKTVDIH